ncbi:MAG: 3-hydroxyacyl-CoA dehydrogenase NAD-binding domain-containing protein [Natronomonas sp.]|jgi:3-hydroxybutyryl-CoA dehydrogenase|uniref:3-hydroxyacyl-CoA dehydrogenase family protein n=1 Tax=Natronomonas sp. TaxID=2184060 RepID=UPI0028708266|nr:3-hydroxyacyl-CoA dehydrogenase NAD-binding domain-containing protein [Natronomonas sp.]MDR9429429.1 3-hydroxyacyl-CoA dehydrogenase NAD-binding domain-containing protein [Natronomonas sp.]
MSHVQRTAIIGAGIMGCGLATHFARHGIGVMLIDHRQSNIDDAKATVSRAAAFLESEELATADPDELTDDISFTLDRDSGVRNADLVLETISEDLDAKRALFSDVVSVAPDDAVLATNTSGIGITAIAEPFPDAADRIVGCHWWNPPYMMPLVEIVRGENTADATVERTRSFLESVERTPIVVERDVPGFVWNRIQFAVIRECMHLIEEGVASLEDVNAAVRDGYALRTAVVGPFETIDLTGLELYRTVAEDLYPHLSNDDAPGSVFDVALESGRGGVEAGAGFFEYDDSPEAVVLNRDRRIAAIRQTFSEIGEE